MKKTLIMVGLLALVASTAFAAKGDTWFGVQGGIASPTGDIGKEFKTGYDGSLYGSYGVAKDCQLGLEVGYFAFKAKDDFNTALGTGADAKLSLIPITAFTTYSFPTGNAKSNPYVKLGLGMYMAKSKIDGITPAVDTTITKFGGNVGLGYNYEVSPMYTIGFNVAYHMIMAGDSFKKEDGTKINPSFFTAGINLNFGMKAKK